MENKTLKLDGEVCMSLYLYWMINRLNCHDWGFVASLTWIFAVNGMRKQFNLIECPFWRVHCASGPLFGRAIFVFSFKTHGNWHSTPNLRTLYIWLQRSQSPSFIVHSMFFFLSIFSFYTFFSSFVKWTFQDTVLEKKMRAPKKKAVGRAVPSNKYGNSLLNNNIEYTISLHYSFTCSYFRCTHRKYWHSVIHWSLRILNWKCK